MLKKILTLLGLSLSLSVNAATLITDMGQLIGATDVVINSIDYDVEFIDGTCVGLFSGCDADSDFLFQTTNETRQASTALNNLVFLGVYDENPALTRGCEDPLRCNIFTPYDSLTAATVAIVSAQQFSGSRFDLISTQFSTSSTSFDQTLNPTSTFAIWSLSVAPPPIDPPPPRDPLRMSIPNIDRDAASLINAYIVAGDDPGIRIQGVSFLSPDYIRDNGVPWEGRRMLFDDPVTWNLGKTPADGDYLEWHASFVTPYASDTLVIRDPTAGLDTPKYSHLDILNSSTGLPQIYGGEVVVEHSQDTLRVGRFSLRGTGGSSNGDQTFYDPYSDRYVFYNMFEGAGTPTIEADYIHINGAFFDMQAGRVAVANILDIDTGGFTQHAGEVTTSRLDIGYGTASSSYSLNGGTLNTGGVVLGWLGDDTTSKQTGYLYLNGGDFNSIGARAENEWLDGISIASGALFIRGNASVNKNPLDNNLNNVGFLNVTRRSFDNESAVYDRTSSDVNFKAIYLTSEVNHKQALYEKSGSGTTSTNALWMNEGSVVRQSAGEIALVDMRAADGSIIQSAPLSITEYWLSGGRLSGRSISVDGQLNMSGGSIYLNGGVEPRIDEYDRTTNGSAGLGNHGTIAMSSGVVSGDDVFSGVRNHGDGIFRMSGDSLIDVNYFHNSGQVSIGDTAEVNLSHEYLQSSQIPSHRGTTVNGILRADTVEIYGGILQGSGSIIGDVTIYDGASVAPGNSPGTLFIDGDFTLEEGAKLILEIVEDGMGGYLYDELSVSGVFNLLGDIKFYLGEGLDVGVFETTDPEEGPEFSITDFFTDGTGNLFTLALFSDSNIKILDTNGATFNMFLVDDGNGGLTTEISAVPVPAAVWFFSTGLIGLIGIARSKNA